MQIYYPNSITLPPYHEPMILIMNDINWKLVSLDTSDWIVLGELPSHLSLQCWLNQALCCCLEDLTEERGNSGRTDCFRKTGPNL